MPHSPSAGSFGFLWGLDTLEDWSGLMLRSRSGAPGSPEAFSWFVDPRSRSLADDSAVTASPCLVTPGRNSFGF